MREPLFWYVFDFLKYTAFFTFAIALMTPQCNDPSSIYAPIEDNTGTEKGPQEMVYHTWGYVTSDCTGFVSFEDYKASIYDTSIRYEEFRDAKMETGEAVTIKKGTYGYARDAFTRADPDEKWKEGVHFRIGYSGPSYWIHSYNTVKERDYFRYYKRENTDTVSKTHSEEK